MVRIGELGSVSLVDCTIANNSAVNQYGNAYGGGVYTDSAGSDLVLVNCTLYQNSVEAIQGVQRLGGGIDAGAGTVQLVNCTLANNSACTAPGYRYQPAAPPT